MKSTSESLSHRETSNGGIAARCNCVVVRRGGEQPEANMWSQTKVNPIRFATAASLRGIGEACGKGDRKVERHFDAIPHQRLMALVREHIAGGRVLGLIEGFLKQGLIEGANWQEAKEGTPQGGVISPLLANIYLNPLDWLMAGLGFEMVRYADDMVVLCRSQEESGAALEKLREWMAEAELTLHPEKTRTVDMNKAESHFDFLGYRFKRSHRGGLIPIFVS